METAALKGINLEIKDGEFVDIMGASGSGKSTLLHLLGGLDYPSATDCFRPVDHRNPRNPAGRNVRRAKMASITAREFLFFGQKLRRARIEGKLSMFLEKRLTWDWGSPWTFFILVFGATWVFLVPIALSGRPIQDPLVLAAAAAGLLGAIVVDLFLAHRLHGPAGVRDFWVRASDPRRIAPAWYAVIFLSQPILTGLALLTHLALGGAMPSLDTPARFLANPLSILPFAAFILVYGPLPEELGWRGYVLDRLQLRYNAVVSSLILGALWGIWHLPLFFIPGTYQRDQLGSVAALVLGTMIFSVLMTWIYNNTHRSTLSAILFHLMMNFTGEFFAFPVVIKNYVLLWAALWAAVVVIRWGPRRLS